MTNHSGKFYTARNANNVLGYEKVGSYETEAEADAAAENCDDLFVISAEQYDEDYADRVAPYYKR